MKALDVLLEACARLERAGVSFQCRLVGDGPLRSRLAEQIGRLGLESRVTLQGARPHDELPDWFRAADAVALSSHSEGVPNVLLEAAACGIPFVATRVGGIPEIAGGPPNRLVEPGDPAGLAEAIAAMLADAPRAAAPPRAASWRSSACALAESLEAARAQHGRWCLSPLQLG